jgi:hypothetical protein
MKHHTPIGTKSILCLFSCTIRTTSSDQLVYNASSSRGPNKELNPSSDLQLFPVGGVHQSDSVLQNVVVVVEDGVNCYESSNTQ